MTRQKKLNFKALLLLLIAIMVVAGVISCNNQRPMGNYSEAINDGDTGLVDGDGNVIIPTNYITNYVTNNKYTTIFKTNHIYYPDLIIYKTNTVTIKGEVKTEYIYIDKVITNKIEVTTNITPDPKDWVSKWHNSMMYRVYAPFSGIGADGDYKYTNLSYMDTPTLSATWKKVIKNTTPGKGFEFTIRNKQSGTYFYFDDNVDIRWSKKPNVVVKKFIQGLIIKHICGNDTKGAYAIAGLYRLTKHTSELSDWYDDGVNLLQGNNFRWVRNPGEYDIIVLNPGHVINGSEYGLEIYNASSYDEFGYAQRGNGYFEERPEVYMQKITHVTELWKNYRPWELYDLTFQKTKR